MGDEYEYGKISEEIEPALDDLTLDTLQIVINQYYSRFRTKIASQ